jgi:hypothetical protein
MFASVFSLLLISSYQVTWPNPYLGYGFGLSKAIDKQSNNARTPHWRSFINFGFPLKLRDGEISDPYSPVLTTLVEFGYDSDVFQVNLAGGFEGERPLGYRARMSSFVWGAQAGIHYGLLRLKNYLGPTGKVMNTEESTSIAALVNLYIGPRFEISDRYALRCLINPKIIAGKIAYGTFRTEFSQWLGWTLSMNLQFEFL